MGEKDTILTVLGKIIVSLFKIIMRKNENFGKNLCFHIDVSHVVLPRFLRQHADIFFPRTASEPQAPRSISRSINVFCRVSFVSKQDDGVFSWIK